MRVAVTGAHGFIGRQVCTELTSRGHQAVAIDRANGLDVRDGQAMIQALDGCDHVIHLAGVLGTAELFDTPCLAVHVNVAGTMNILVAAERAGAGYTGITMPRVFPSLYTATKVGAGALEECWRISKGLPASRVRAFNAYGPGQAHGPGHPQKIVPTFAVHAWANLPIPIWGDGEQTVDLIDTTQLARMLVDARHFGDGETFDGGTGKAFTVNEVAEMVIAITGSTAGVEHLPMRLGEVPTDIVAEGEGWNLLWQPTFDEAVFEEAVLSYRWVRP